VNVSGLKGDIFTLPLRGDRIMELRHVVGVVGSDFVSRHRDR